MKFTRFAPIVCMTVCLAASPDAVAHDKGDAVPVTGSTGFLDRTMTVGGVTRRYQVFVPSGYSPERRWPLVLALHGSGERGTDGLLQTEVGLGSAIRRHVERFPAIVVFPQAPPGLRWTGAGADIALEALEAAEREFSIDAARVYLTGLSMGGSGAWHVAYRHPDRFAALLIICARLVPGGEALEPLAPPADGIIFDALTKRLKHLPTWIFHGDKDSVIPVEESRRIYETLRAAGAAVHYSELPGVDHNSWDAAYNSPEVVEWLLAQRRAAGTRQRSPLR